MQPLALQASLHVGEGDDDRVDVTRLDLGAELLDGQCRWLCHGSFLSDQATKQRGGRIAVLLHRHPGAVRVAAEDGVDDLLVLGVECSMLRRSTGIAMSMSCRADCDRVTASIEHRGARQRRDREVQARVRDPVGRGLGGVGRPPAGCRRARPAGRRRAAGSPRARPHRARPPVGRSARPASRPRSARRCRRAPRSASRVEEEGCGAAYVTRVPPPRPRRVVTSPASRRAAIASRNVVRLTARRSASSRSGGSCSPSAMAPSRIARASCSTVFSKALPSSAGRSTASDSAVCASSSAPLTAAISVEQLRRGLRVVTLGDVTHEVLATAEDPGPEGEEADERDRHGGEVERRVAEGARRVPAAAGRARR